MGADSERAEEKDGEVGAKLVKSAKSAHDSTVYGSLTIIISMTLREEEAGILCYADEADGFQCILKHR